MSAVSVSRLSGGPVSASFRLHDPVTGQDVNLLESIPAVVGSGPTAFLLDLSPAVVQGWNAANPNIGAGPFNPGTTDVFSFLDVGGVAGLNMDVSITFPPGTGSCFVYTGVGTIELDGDVAGAATVDFQFNQDVTFGPIVGAEINQGDPVVVTPRSDGFTVVVTATAGFYLAVSEDGRGVPITATHEIVATPAMPAPVDIAIVHDEPVNADWVTSALSPTTIVDRSDTYFVATRAVTAKSLSKGMYQVYVRVTHDSVEHIFRVGPLGVY